MTDQENRNIEATISPRRRGLASTLITMGVLLLLWWLVHRWFEDSLIAEERGQFAVVQRSVWALQIVGLVVVVLGSVLAYVIAIRQARLAQTVEAQLSELVQARELLEKRVTRRTQELETLLRVSRDLTATLDLKTLLGRIVEQLRLVVAYDSAGLFDLVDDAYLDVLLYVGPQETGSALTHVALDAPLIADIIRQQQPILVPDTQADTPAAQSLRTITGGPVTKIGSWLAVPLLLKDRAIGMLELGHCRPNFYTARHVELALAFANQAAIAIENARLYEQAQTLASLEERRHLARELHDSVSQALYGIALGTRTARMLLDRDPTKLVEPLDYIMNLAEAGLTEMRALIFELRPEILESEGLVGALSKQAEALRVRHKLQVETRFDPEPEVPLPCKEALYRIAQEATHNVVKHAKAERITLSLRNGEGLTLEIDDDGQGFDPHQTFAGHLGLRSMRERIEKLGGRFEVESEPGKGTTVRVCLP
ncbi:MAG: GAF domain-containing sensor histidine kinase [Anaerolineae bacterium]|nr:GAF domain-containing sensor histidine kinase [Anaerolineae bacterium]